MKLVLIQPPIQDYYDTPIRLQPLGLAYLKAAVKKYLPEVEVIVQDFHHGRGRRTLALPKELVYLKDYYPWPDRSPFSLFHPYYHFGASFETLAREVACEKPDLVGISSLFSPYYREVLGCVEAIKNQIACPIVIGGSHASSIPEWMLGHPEVDWVIQGEGERPLVELLKAIQKGEGFDRVSGLGYKQAGRMVFNPPGNPYPLGDLPFPDYSDIGRGIYQYEKRPLCFILTSRGCPHQCSFCSVHRTFPGYRRRSAQDVLAEMVQRYEEGYRVFDFEDDNLTFDKEGMRELCRNIHQTFPPGTIECLAMNGISYQSLDTELLVLMKGAGFTHLNISLVTADAKVRKNTARTQGLEPYIEVVKQAFRLQFKIVSYQILGLPDESLDSMIRTMHLNAKLPVLMGASPFYLTPGTPISEKFPKPTEADIFKSRLTALALETDHFRREDIYTLFVTARIINFFKGLHLDEASSGLNKALKTAGNQSQRSALGAALFERLLTEGRLYAATPEGYRPLTRFRSELFVTLWTGLDQIKTQEGKIIQIH
jgi:radical SAM superfamily enzyme YgiQ (UPF0313 family)